MLRTLITTVPFGQYNSFLFENLKNAGLDVTINPIGRRLTEDELANMVEEYDILIAGTEPITSKVIACAKRLKLISRVGIGLDNVDLCAAKTNGIKVSYTPEAPTEAVAELTIGAIFTLLRGMHIVNLQMHRGVWERLFGRRIEDVTIGVIGCGRIGRSVLKRLVSLDVGQILVNDIDPDVRKSLPFQAQWSSLTRIYNESDVITLHLPLTKTTRNMISYKEFNSFKKGSMLINTSRSGIIVEADLIDALKTECLAAAAIDVFDEEPYYGGLCEIDRCLLTSHMGSMSVDCRSRMEIEAAEEAIRFSEGKALKNEVPEFEYDLAQGDLYI